MLQFFIVLCHKPVHGRANKWLPIISDDVIRNSKTVDEMDLNDQTMFDALISHRDTTWANLEKLFVASKM